MNPIPRERRQYRIMVDRLEEFKRGDLFLDRPINDLDALLEILENPEEAWKENFRSSWGVLEQIHAVALDRK